MRTEYDGDRHINIAESKADFDGWEILLIEDWKPGVKRVHMRKIDPSGFGKFMMVFADEKFTEGLHAS